MIQTKEEKENIQALKVAFNKLHAAGQLLIEMANELMPKEHEDVIYACEFLANLQELTTCIPRAYLQMMHDNSEESKDFPLYPLLLTGFPNSMVYAWLYTKKMAKVFKGGKKKFSDQLDTVNAHIYSCAALIYDLYKHYRAVAVVHKSTGVVLMLNQDDITSEEKNEYIEICPELIYYDRKYMDAVYKCCATDKSKRRKDTVIYKVPESSWPKKGKGRTYNSEAFKNWLMKVRVAICTTYDLSYNENL